MIFALQCLNPQYKHFSSNTGGEHPLNTGFRSEGYKRLNFETSPRKLPGYHLYFHDTPIGGYIIFH